MTEAERKARHAKEQREYKARNYQRVLERERDFKRHVSPEWRKKYRRKYYALHPAKKRAHETVYRALRSGRLTKTIYCQLCWRTDCPLEAHHGDYSKKLDVVWLCRSCHCFVDNHKLGKRTPQGGQGKP